MAMHSNYGAAGPFGPRTCCPRRSLRIWSSSTLPSRLLANPFETPITSNSLAGPRTVWSNVFPRDPLYYLQCAIISTRIFLKLHSTYPHPAHVTSTKKLQLTYSEYEHDRGFGSRRCSLEWTARCARLFFICPLPRGAFFSAPVLFIFSPTFRLQVCHHPSVPSVGFLFLISVAFF